MERLEADVCVIGAGFAGLAAARKLTEGGRTVVVLEARDRVGGRTLTERLRDGIVLDHGGAWLAPDHTAARELVAAVGAHTYPTYCAGKSIYVKRGRPRHYKGDVPYAVGIPALAGVGVALALLDRMALKVPVDAPWDAPRAAAWDNMTLATWLNRHIAPGTGRRMARLALEQMFTAGAGELSVLGVLLLIRGHGGLQPLFSIEGGAQQDRVAGGMGTVAELLAAELGDRVHLGAPVRRVTVDGDRVTVRADELSVDARRLIVAVPPVLRAGIEFEPGLPSGHRHLALRMPVGPITKIAVVYDEPFWRADGLTAISLDMDSLATITLDGSPEHSPPGVINVIVSGPQQRDFARLDAAERRTLVVDAMVQRFGPKAASVAHYTEHDWAAEQYTLGGSMAHFPPGVLTGYGRALREPVGPIHWAGSETATISHGAIDGAVRSGQRAASEILAALEGRPAPVMATA